MAFQIKAVTDAYLKSISTADFDNKGPYFKMTPVILNTAALTRTLTQMHGRSVTLGGFVGTAAETPLDNDAENGMSSYDQNHPAAVVQISTDGSLVSDKNSSSGENSPGLGSTTGTN